jgi:hypothetical protein
MACLCSSAVLSLAAQAAPFTLPAHIAVPPASVHTRGFIVRTVQAPEDAALPNSYVRAYRQLNGTLTNAAGQLVPNEAIPNPNTFDYPDGSYPSDTIDFELTGLAFDIFTPVVFPGIPGANNHTRYFATEVISYVELPAGTHTFGFSVGSDRTDVNDDDSYKMFAGANPRSYFNPVVGEFERTAPPFVANTHNTNHFDVIAPVYGVYPIRVVHWQTTRGANLQMYTVDPDTGDRILVNSTDPRALFAYQFCTVAQANTPYVAEASPVPGASGIAPDEPVQVLLLDGENPVNTSSIRLYLNGTRVTPQTVSKQDNRTWVIYRPNASRTEVNNAIRLEFADTAGVSTTNAWAFTITVTGGPRSLVAGQWDFDQANLAATVGSPLEYLDGPNGQTATKSQFGNTRQLGIPDLNGQPANVLKVPGDLDRRIGYIMRHGIAPNGGGTLVNQYTLIMDIYVETAGSFAASLLQIDSQDNALGNDGDLFWQQGNFGQGTGGYNGTGAFTAGAWHRVCAAYDMAANPPVVTKYVDGIKQDDWTASQALDAPRRALKPTAVLFGDGDQDERRVMYVNSIQIRSGKLTDGEMVALGGPDACGIPRDLPPVEVAGQWDFERGDLAATVGKPLQYLGGAGSTAQTLTQFGDTTSFSLADINGEAAKVIRVPGDLTREIGYVMTHGIAPNGGGTLVNQYTLIMDIYVETTGSFAASLLQIDSPDNALGNDGDLFWQQGNFGQGTGGYNGTGAFTAGAWHRICAAYDMAASPPVVTKYVDGIKQDDWTASQALDEPRRALKPTALLFGDGDQDERRVMYVNSIQIRPRKLTDAEMTALGGPSAKGIPVVLPSSNVSGQWDFDQGNLAATVGKPLQYLGGAGSTAQTLTQFGDTTTFSIADINGEAAKVIRVPGDLTREIGYVMPHGIAPNGGGTLVNQYTLIMDIYVETAGSFAASLLQIDSQDNALGNDGDLFWQQGNFGQGTGGYNGTGAFTAGAWHRICAAYNMAATPPGVVKYVDGIFQDNWTANQALDGPRRALKPTAVLFGDGDQDERRVMFVNSIQIRSGALSRAEMEALGGPQASGIPVVVPLEKPPRLCLGRSGNQLSLVWSLEAQGYTLETTQNLAANPVQWEAVPDTAHNAAIVEIGAGNRFFRLRK